MVLLSKVSVWCVLPRFWLTLGAVLIVASMGLSYHNDQTLADKALATKVDLPDPVRIQEFDRAENINLLGEVQLLAEADLSQSVLRQFGEGAAGERYLLLPVYPVSQGSVARSNALTDTPTVPSHRPVLRTDAVAETVPFAVLVYEVTDTVPRPRMPEAFGLRVLGRGFSGDLVLFSGVAFSRAIWADGTSRAEVEAAARDTYGLAESENLSLIAPFEALRASAPAADMTDERNALVSAGLVAVLFGLSLLVRGLKQRPVVLKTSGSPRADHSASRPSAAFFDPLLPQDEIGKSEREARVSSEMSIARITRSIGPILSRIKSRR